MTDSGSASSNFSTSTVIVESDTSIPEPSSLLGLLILGGLGSQAICNKFNDH